MLSKWPWAWQSQWALWREAYRTTATPLGLERLVGTSAGDGRFEVELADHNVGEFAGSERANRLPSEHAIVSRIGHVHMVIDLVDDDRARNMIAGEIQRAGRERIRSVVGKVRLTEHARSSDSGAGGASPYYESRDEAPQRYSEHPLFSRAHGFVSFTFRGSPSPVVIF